MYVWDSKKLILTGFTYFCHQDQNLQPWLLNIGISALSARKSVIIIKTPVIVHFMLHNYVFIYIL